MSATLINGKQIAKETYAELKERTEAALALWRDPEKRKKLVAKIMKTDFSWSISAEKYLEMYNSL